MIKDYYPQRIVCLTDETTETLYLLGEEERIVGISGFTTRPERVCKEKPKVSAFLDANLDEIMELQPDLVIGFSDIQAELASKLIKNGLTVWINNHRSVAGIMKMMLQLGSLVGKTSEAMSLVAQVEQQILAIKTNTSSWKKRPRVYFEEWYDPLITGIEWVSEIIRLAGGEDVFPEFFGKPMAKQRIIANPATVIERNPDIMLASWCGKMMKREKIVTRTGWQNIKAIENDDIYEIKSDIILQPGPAALLEGLPNIHRIFEGWL